MKQWKLFAAASMLIGATPAYAGNEAVIINEIRIDQTSTDNDEYLELKGPPGASLDGLTYITLGDGTGGSGVVEAVVDLTGQNINDKGFFVVAESTFSLGAADLTATLNFENDDNITHILVSGFTGASADDLDTDDNGTLDSTPWTGIVDLIALIKEENPPTTTEFHYGPPTIGPEGTFTPGHVYRCTPDDEWSIGAFDPASKLAADTPGEINVSCDLSGEDCDADGTPDALEIELGDEEDCNGNGVPDNCDIAIGVSQDCNDNGIPDSCDLKSGVLVDADGDGVPDSCEVVAPDDLLINEIRLEQPGADNDEYFELKGTAPTSLNGVRYIVIGNNDAGSNSGVIECVVNLDGSGLGFDGLFLAAEDTYSLSSILSVDLLIDTSFDILNFEGFDNKTHLLVANFFGSRGQDLDTNDDGVLDIIPWLDELDRIAIIIEENPPAGTEYHYGPPTVGPDGPFLPGHVYRCEPEGDWLVGAFDPADPIAVDTPATQNPGGCKVEPVCPADLDMSGTVGFADLLIVLNAWADEGGPADLDGSGTVGFADLLIVLNAWGDCPKV